MIGALTRSVTRHLAPARRDRADAARRVSSGLRIQRAADDPAGTAIATNQRVRMGSLRQARRNASEGIGALDVADAGLAAISGMIKRLRELAVRAASDTISDAERALIQDEVRALRQQIDQTARGARYDGVGTLSLDGIDVGLVVDTTASMGDEVDAMRAAIRDFQQVFRDNGLDVAIGLSVFKVGIDNVDGVRREVDIGEEGLDAAIVGIRLSASPVDPWSALVNVAGAYDVPGDADPDTFSFRFTSLEKHLVLITDTGRERNLLPAGWREEDVADALRRAGVVVDTINPAGRNAAFDDIVAATGGAMHEIGAGGSGIDGALQAIATDIADRLGSAAVMEIQVGTDGTADHRVPAPHPVDATSAGLGLSELDLSSVSGARTALDTLDVALDTVNGMRSRTGAARARLESALRLDDQTLLDLDAARSRLEDADVATEAATHAKAGILEEVGLAVAAQARQLEEAVARALLDDIERGDLAA